MAASFAACRLPVRGTSRALRRLHSVETGPQRRAVTSPAAAALSPGLMKSEESGDQEGWKAFSVVQLERHEQAERSVLISCNKTNEKMFLKYLSMHGDIKNCFFYDSFGTHAVVEFASRESIASLHETVAVPVPQNESVVPFKSRLLSLRNVAAAAVGTKRQPEPQRKPQGTIPINELIKRLSKEMTIDHQIMTLTKAYQVTEENTRLRFLVCSLLRDMIGTYFPSCHVRPFGSSVNGFGKLGCDLDMLLDLDGGGSGEKPEGGMSLEYQMKRASSERAATQSILSVVGECLEKFGPGCVGVQKILNARCPLVRFAHQPSTFQCDLTANNRVAIKTSELLYLYGQLDERVRGLVFAVRCWARAHSVTSSIPGAWITNFSLTVMVLFFLQRRATPLIPHLDHLRSLAGPADKSVIEGNDCSFVSDLRKIKLQDNTETLEQLLRGFFDFYSTFAFDKMSINIRKGMAQNKPEAAPLHIQNPFEAALNVSKNVNVAQLERFVTLCQDGAWHLELSGGASLRGPGASPEPWGLAALLLPSQAQDAKRRKSKKRDFASERMKSLLESLKMKR